MVVIQTTELAADQIVCIGKRFDQRGDLLLPLNWFASSTSRVVCKLPMRPDSMPQAMFGEERVQLIAL
ncbi:hypothetical protein [Ralstonia pseudosolanacearum]|uniref:hypothetical protein n=1 Tax=Ralstonia pseudosolanacearum TaxID=1310165 RepID=UPI0018D14CBD|nr:hypothetical protein [Ralstonia pseudosolanacearum]UWD88760.1 hypothetical protein NY025_01080 [Ralstonia pseudosolanacearum]